MKTKDWINIWIIAIITWVFVINNQITFVQEVSYGMGVNDTELECLERLDNLKNSI